MRTRAAVMSIIVENVENVQLLNKILLKCGCCIIGRTEKPSVITVKTAFSDD